MSDPQRLRSVCYVVKSFPQPSETFIADEAADMARLGVAVSILHLQAGETDVLHPSSAWLLAHVPVQRVGHASRGAVLRALGQMLLHRPLATLREALRAAHSPQRWLHAQALAVAPGCLARGVEFIHAHFADYNLQFALALGDWLGVPVGVTTHRYDLLEDPIGHETAVRCLRDTQLKITISEWNRAYMQRHFRLKEASIHVVHCGVDLASFPYRPAPPRAAGDPLRLVNVARLAPVKGHAVLLHALALAKAQGMDATLEIVGDGPLRADLESLSTRLGLKGSVHFHGVQPQSFVRKCLLRNDVFVLPSFAEGIPVACMEAMATGPVLIASRINGLPELVEDGRTGLLVPADDAEALAKALRWVESHYDELPLLSHAARARVEAEFSRPRSTETLLNLMSAAKRSPSHP